MPTVICPTCQKLREVAEATAVAVYVYLKAPPPCRACAAAARTTAVEKPRCVHCLTRSGCRPRGLCERCHLDPTVRALHPVKRASSNNRGHGTGNRRPATPTTAAPGTEEKMVVLEARAKRGEFLHHEADARYEGDPRPLEFLYHEACAV